MHNLEGTTVLYNKFKKSNKHTQAIIVYTVIMYVYNFFKIFKQTAAHICFFVIFPTFYY